MANTILVVAEQREGKLNRVSLETITAAQSIASACGWGLEAAVIGANIDPVAQEIAKTRAAKVYSIEAAELEQYTADAYVAALKEFISSKQPRLVLMPHTYQVR